MSAPVLVVTGHYLDPETENHALAAGATAFKYKPFWADEVTVLLRDLLNGIRRLSLPDPAAAAAAPANWFVENPVRGKLLIVRVLPTLDRLAARPDTSHDQACLVEPAVPRQGPPVTLVAAFCLPLAAIGLSGALLYSVQVRTRETAIRIALGAEPRMVRQAVVLRAVTIVALGILLGTVLGIAAGRVATHELFNVHPADPWTMASVAIGLLALAWVAALLPAHRASRTAPATLLRHE